jgi:hypothetical protein
LLRVKRLKPSFGCAGKRKLSFAARQEAAPENVNCHLLRVIGLRHKKKRTDGVTYFTEECVVARNTTLHSIKSLKEADLIQSLSIGVNIV